MKLHNLSVIFVIIAIPLILITSYYISLQIDTINMQTAYNTKLLDSTKEAIDAFEINTVEWNANYSETADSKRRDIMASINTFTSSFANNIGIGGASKEYIMAYMPAIAYTLYDGYYIYSPANTKVAITDDNDVGVVMTKEFYDKNKNVISNYDYKEDDDGKLLYKTAEENSDGKYNGIAFTLDQSKAATEDKHILKPFASYSEKIEDWVINYTLDNYITIYGNVKNSETNEDEFVSKSGYLTVIGDDGISDFSPSSNNNTIKNIKFKKKEMTPEKLSEKIAYKENDEKTTEVNEGIFRYVYEADNNTKVYFTESGEAFIVGSNLVKVKLSQQINKYKKVTIPQYKSGSWTYKVVYQSLYDGKWYDKDKKTLIGEDTPGYGIEKDKNLDYSAINYCVESYIVTKFVNGSEVKPSSNSEGVCTCGYSHGNNNPLNINSSNDPESKDSDFSTHRRGIIKNAIESNLNQAITSYSRNSEGEYKLPKLTETDWDQILRNVSIITFVQNIPIGMKYYNNYAIATSTMNKEYVDPEEIYLNATGDEYYHMPYCEHLEETNNIIGYRSIDYVQRTYTQTGEEEPTYYYKHAKEGNETGNQSSSINVNQACYYCLVQKSLYKEDKNEDKKTAYNTALARERYVARMAKLPAEVEASYNIIVTPYSVEKVGEEEKEVIASSAQYYINNTIYRGKGKVKIDKTSKLYEIKPTFGEQNTLDNNLTTDDLGSFGAEKATSTEKGNNYSVYKSDSEATVTINEYKSEGINFSVNATEWTAGYSENTTEQMNNFGPEADGYINIRLKYEKNYAVGNESSGISAFANIDSENKLTIVTNTGDIKGFVRLRFTNTNNEGQTLIYYSKDIFNIANENASIYCKIENDNSWYNNDWKVEILNVAGENIKPTATTEYYTIRDTAGLKGFSKAVNEGAKTEGRTFKLIEDIEGVGELSPIAGIKNIGDNGWNNIWFKGDFQGQDHTISGITMNYSDDSGYNAFGLFGWVGKEAKISNLKIGINVSVTKSNFDEKYKENRICVGGIAGYTDAQISNCTILNSSNIGKEQIEVLSGSDSKDKYYVGGIAGYAGNTIIQPKIDNDVNVTGGKISNANKNDDKNLQTYTGGVVGYKNTTQPIDGSFTISCKVSGHDNVGGIVGFNKSGDIKNVSFNGKIQGDGENIGGIVGCNTGGTISNCTNQIEINVAGESVGGIVGCNSNSNVEYCYNKGNVKGNRNVGGITGASYGGTINYCGNEASVIGESNINKITIHTETGPIDNGYGIGSKTCTGTGGIAGKIYKAIISCSYNSGNISCNFNGGGISGLAYSAEIKYCYNTSKIIARIIANSDEMRNRLGGICGAAIGIKLDACYNTGEIKGKNTDGDLDAPLWVGVGGILGFIIDDSNVLKQDKLELKYINIDFIGIEKIKNEVNYCYNVGKVTGDYEFAIETTHYNGGIVGSIGVGNSGLNKTIFTECYYLNNSPESGRGTNSLKKEDKATGKEGKDLQELLYTWANGIVKNNIYNTTAPLETDKGYAGYGVLGWQLNDNYVQLTTNMFLCNRSTENNVTTSDYTNFKNTAYNQTIVINNQKKIAFRETKFDTCRITESFNGDPVNNDNGCYRWVMMIPKGTYTFKGTTDFGSKSMFFYNSEQKESEDFEITISGNATLYVAPILEVKPDNFDTKKIEVEWKREQTSITRVGIYTKPDFIPRTIKVNSYYYKKPCNSNYNINGKTASVYLDKIKTDGLNNTTAYLDNYTYYTVGLFKMKGPYTKSGDKEDIRVDSAECNIYVPVQNLVDKLGDEKAKNYILHTAKVNMQYKIKMWCEKGDFGSWWTNPANLKNSKLEYNITVQRKEQGSSNWVKVKSINIPTFYKQQTSESGNIGDDGYYTFDYEINKEDFSGSIADVKYNDELRIVIGLKFKSKEGNCTFYIDSADLDITYGPNLRD